jgi:tetratricopeptide (TPR) repeat protein
MHSIRLRAVALLPFLFFALACGSDAEKAADHLSAGDAYLESKENAEAIIEYRNVLRYEPNNAGAHWGLAQAYLASSKLREGYWELRESVRLDPANLDARIQYGQLSRLAGELDEALAQSAAILEVDEDRMPAWVLKAQTLEAMKQFDEAQDAYAETAKRFPDEAAPLLLTANYYLRQGLREEAETHFLRITEVKPGFSSWAAYGGFLAQDGDRDVEAEDAYKKGRDLAEEDQKILAERVLASFYYSRERFEEAEQVLTSALAERPGDLDLLYVLARFYAARGDQDRADKMIEEATRAKPDEVQPWLVLSAYRGKQGDLEGALEAADSALKVDSENLPARLRRAELLLDIGYREKDAQKIARGRSIVEAVLSQESSSPEALFVRAKVALAEKKPDEAVGDLRRAIDLKPDWAEAHYLLGSALFIQRDLNGARAEITRALEIDGQLLEARKVLARIHSMAGEHELAAEEGRRVLRDGGGDDVGTRLLVAQSLVRERKLDDAIAELNKIPEDQQTGETLYAMGRVQRFNGNAAQARVNFERAYELMPRHSEILEALLTLDRSENRIEESVVRIEAAAREEPDNARLIHLLGLVQVLTKRGSEAEASFRRAIELDPNQLAPYQSLAQYLALTGRRDEVLATYERAAVTRPDSAGLQLVLGSLYEAYGDLDKARETYEKAIEKDPSLSAAKNNLAYILAESGDDLDRALDLAQEAKASLPENGHAADTLGWVLYKKGIPSAAIGYLKEAEGLFRPDDINLAVVRHHLALAYEAAGERERAKAALDRAFADLEQIRKSYRANTGREPTDPAWLADMQALQQKLNADS